MNTEPMKPEVFFRLWNNNHKSVFYKCNSCKKKVDILEMRRHAESHDTTLRFSEWQTILDLYSIDF